MSFFHSVLLNVFLVWGMVCLYSVGFADTIVVKSDGTGDYPTIQDAIDAAVDGDHVVLLPGVYDEMYITLRGKQITVRSVDPADPDIVDRTILAPIGFPVFALWGDDYPNASIEGLTISNQYFEVRLQQSYNFQPIVSDMGSSSSLTIYPVIKHCVFKNITSKALFWKQYVSIEFQDCKFIHNTLTSELMIVYHSELTLKNCLIADNNMWVDYADWRPPFGLCIQAYDSLLEIDQCTIAHNRGVNNYHTLPSGENVFSVIDCIGGSVTIRDSIIWGNNFVSGDVVNKPIFYTPSSSSPLPSETIVSVSHSDIQSGIDAVYIDTRSQPEPDIIDPNWVDWGAGNIDSDPLFAREPNDGGDGWFLDLDRWQVNPSANNIPGDFHLKSAGGRFFGEGYSRADFDYNKQVDLVDFSFIAQNWLEEGIPSHVRYSWSLYDLDQNWHIGLEDIVLFCGEYLQPRVFGAWVVDDVTSPCIDAGDPNDVGWQEEPSLNGQRVNMGAYGGTGQASKSSIDE